MSIMRWLRRLDEHHFVRQHRIYRTLCIISSDDRSSDRLIDICAGAGIAFIPWYPLAAGRLVSPDSPLVRIAQRLGGTPSQIALAWLLQRSPAMLPIPRTSSIAHLEESLASAPLRLSADEYRTRASLRYTPGICGRQERSQRRVNLAPCVYLSANARRSARQTAGGGSGTRTFGPSREGVAWFSEGEVAAGRAPCAATDRLREYGYHLSSNPRGHRAREPGKIDDILRL